MSDQQDLEHLRTLYNTAFAIVDTVWSDDEDVEDAQEVRDQRRVQEMPDQQRIEHRQGAHCRQRAQRRQRRAPQIPIAYPRFEFNLDLIDDSVLISKLRFSRNDILRLLPFMRLDLCRFKRRYQPSHELALAILLARLAYPGRHLDRLDFFGRSRSFLSSVFNDVVTHIRHRFGALMGWDDDRLTMQQLRRYCEAIGEDVVWGFIDGTAIHMSRPTGEQELFYSGHKHYHAFKFQSVVTPDGLISSLAGPIAAIGTCSESQIEEKIGNLFEREGVMPEDRIYLYGDAAYTGSVATIGAFKRPRNGQLTEDQAWVNLVMSKKRVAVEDIFGLVQKYFAFSSYYLQQRMGDQSVAASYLAACLMTNCMTCLRGRNQVTDKFECPPPTLEEYFASITRRDANIQ